MAETCARCGCYVGLGNLARDYRDVEACDDCFTLLCRQDDVGTGLARYLGALRARLTGLFRG